MKTKKHPKANLENYSKLFTQLGLVLTLIIVYVLIQNKTFEKDFIVLNDSPMNMEDTMEQVIIIKVEPPKVQPKKKIVIDEIIKADDNDDDIVETIIENINPSDPIDDISKIIDTNEDELIGPETVPFIIIEEAPVFPGCEGTEEEMRICFEEKIARFVGKNFNSELAITLGLAPGVKRIFVMFKIDKKGNIVDIESRAPHMSLQNEAERVIKLLPKMTPGKQRKKPVGVKYSIPIVFNVE